MSDNQPAFDPFSQSDVASAIDRQTATIRELAAAGLTDHEIAARMSMPVDAVRAHPDVLSAWGDAHDERVMRALYESAVGSETWADKIDRFGSVQRLSSRLAPDPKAALEWLRARRPQVFVAPQQQGTVFAGTVTLVLGNGQSVRMGRVIEHAPQHETPPPGSSGGAGVGGSSARACVSPSPSSDENQ